MIEDFLLSNFEIFVFLSICILVIGFLLLFLLQNQKHKHEKDLIFSHLETFNKHNQKTKEYLIAVGNLLDQQKKEISKIYEKIVFIEREINRLSDIKGSEDVLTKAIEMAREGSTREEIINKTGLREDEVEAIYTYYRK